MLTRFIGRPVFGVRALGVKDLFFREQIAFSAKDGDSAKGGKGNNNNNKIYTESNFCCAKLLRNPFMMCYLLIVRINVPPIDAGRCVFMSFLALQLFIAGWAICFALFFF